MDEAALDQAIEAEMAELDKMETVKNAGGADEAIVVKVLTETTDYDDQQLKRTEKVEVLEHKIIKMGSDEVVVEKPDEGQKEEKTETNGSAPLFKARPHQRRTFITNDELDKELEATMEQLESGTSSNVIIINNGSGQVDKSIQEEDLIAILEGNHGEAEVVTEANAEKEENMAAKIALQQIMSLPKLKKGRKPKLESRDEANDLVSSLVNDWSDDNDNEVEYEVTATESKTSNETTITISPTVSSRSAAGGGKTGAAKRKQPQGVVADVPDSGSVEIIQTVVEPKPRIINKDAAKVAAPNKFERRRVIKKKVIWDPDDPTPPTPSTKIGNTTIKKVLVPAPADPKPVQAKKKRGKSEIDKLLGDEGAVNMLYSVERENNADLPEIKQAVEEQMIDVEEEQNNLLKKANALKNAVINQTKSPPNAVSGRAARAKRAATPTAVAQEQVPTKETTTAASTPQSATKKQTQTKKRKSDTNESWDYVYKARQNEDSMIIRRHSNSSMSSTTSPRRLSLDQSNPQQNDNSNDTSTHEEAEATEKNVKQTAPPTKKSRGSKNFEFAKPNSRKSAAKKPVDTSKLVEQIRGKLKPKPIPRTLPTQQQGSPSSRTSLVTSPSTSLTSFNTSSPTNIPSPDKRKTLDSKQLSIKKYDKFAFLILPSIDGKVKDCLTLQLLNKIIAALKQLENDTLCNAVVITSAGTDFCRGINYNILVQIDEEKRTNCAREFASAVRKFIFALATFPKPLICGLQSGEVFGIGVTILPLFDLVIARDDVKLSAPYGLMGYFPEGLSVLRLLNKIKTRTVSELFYCNRSLTAEEAIEHELVTKTVSKSNFNEDILALARSVVASSTQALLSIKATLTRDLIEQIDEALAEEEHLLIQHWISPECQDKFRNFLINGHW